MQGYPLDNEFRDRIKEILRSQLAEGSAEEQGGDLSLGPANTLEPRVWNHGGKKSVRIPRSDWVWHTHPGTCDSKTKGCSLEVPSETDMANAFDAGISNRQKASIVFGHTQTFVVGVRSEFVQWFRKSGLDIKASQKRLKRALERYQKKPRVPKGTGPFYRKTSWHTGFKKGWPKFAASIRFKGRDGMEDSPHVFNIWVYNNKSGGQVYVPNLT